MGIGGIWQWVVVLAIVLILFGGRGKISQLMGDFGRGLRSFKKGVKEDPKIIPTFEAHARNSKLLVHAITTWENTEGVIGIVGREHLEAVNWGHGAHNLSNYLHQ